jgi:ribosomal protein S18 acetylase RimI-like enzyme
MPSTTISSRPYAVRDDLRQMESIVSAAWAGPGRPFVHCTIGDLEWWFASGGPDAAWSDRIRIWSIGGAIAGWGWIAAPASLDWFVRDGLPDDQEQAVRREILAWHAETATAAHPPPDGLLPDLWAADGWPESAALSGLGWTATEVVLTQYLQALDIGLDPPRVPDGYVLRSLRGPEDIAARVEVHRAAFAPSRMTVEKYAILVDQDHYRFDRDIVLEAADGTFAAFAMCWIDPHGSIGEFEPVGVHPDHQRRGLGRVIMRHGLRLMRSAGLRDALVFSLRTNVASEALYRSAGFREVALHRRYTKAVDG